MRILVLYHSTAPVPHSIIEQLAEDVRTNRRLWIAIHCRGALLRAAGADSCPRRTIHPRPRPQRRRSWRTFRRGQRHENRLRAGHPPAGQGGNAKAAPPERPARRHYRPMPGSARGRRPLPGRHRGGYWNDPGAGPFPASGQHLAGSGLGRLPPGVPAYARVPTGSQRPGGRGGTGHGLRGPGRAGSDVGRRSPAGRRPAERRPAGPDAPGGRGRGQVSRLRRRPLRPTPGCDVGSPRRGRFPLSPCH